MDGLHEDLNRIKKKPYVEGLDQKEGESEAEYAAAEWDRYKQRTLVVVVVVVVVEWDRYKQRTSMER